MVSRGHNYVLVGLNNKNVLYYEYLIFYFSYKIPSKKSQVLFQIFFLGFKLIDIKLQIPTPNMFELIQSVDQGKRPHTMVS